MILDTTGALLEGVRSSPSVGATVSPPRTISSNSSLINNIPQTLEYCVYVNGMGDKYGYYITDPALKFSWSKNDGITRFGFNSKLNRYFPYPGSSPTNIGVLNSSSSITVPIPVVASTSPYQIYLELPRIYNFSYQLVDSFSSPPAGVVQILKSSGLCKFSDDDINNPLYSEKNIFISQQNFFDPSVINGNISVINNDGSYLAYVNPIPRSGDYPLIRVGSRKYLNAVAYANESSMPLPSTAGNLHYALDTGRILIYLLPEYLNENIYYDGIYNGYTSPNQYSLGTIAANGVYVSLVSNSASFTNVTDTTRYVFWLSDSGQVDYYLNVRYISSTPVRVNSGYVFIDTVNGNVYMNSFDISRLGSRELRFLDTYLLLENGVSFQVNRSGTNGIGEPKVYDFNEFYHVSNVKVSDKIVSPFVILPCTPLNDSSLTYDIQKSGAGVGTYVGPLTSATELTSNGRGYYVDYDKKYLYFTNRTKYSVSLLKAASLIKLNNASIVPNSIEVKKNGSTVDFNDTFFLDENSGLLTSIEQIGESSSISLDNLSGIANGDTFSTQAASFTNDFKDAYLVVNSGANAGIYQITTVNNPKLITLDRPFPENGSITVNTKNEKDDISVNILRYLNPPMKKFKIEKREGNSFVYNDVPQDSYTLIPQLGQVNFKQSIAPGVVFKVNYISNDSTDNGVTYTSNPRVEFLSTKVRLETATYASGSSVIHFNPDGKTVDRGKSFKVVVNGVTVPSNKCVFVDDSTIQIGVVLTNESVLIDYWIEETTGGNLTFNLTYTPVDADLPSFNAGSDIAVLNGDLTSNLTVGSIIVINTNDLYKITEISYDSTSDTTTVKLNIPIINTYVGGFYVSPPLSYSFINSSSTPLSNGSNSFKINGYVFIPSNSVIQINTYYFWVSSASYIESENVTEVILKSPAPKNFLNPAKYLSKRAITLNFRDFNTTKRAFLNYDFNLFLTGSPSRLLDRGLDYEVSDGGSVRLSQDLGPDEYLTAFYVAYGNIDKGTKFDFNYSYKISPDVETNGLLGQSLYSTYDLYNPDSWYYRIVTVSDYISEIKNDLSNSIAFSTSGPSVQLPPSISNTTNGVPTPYYDEVYYGNLDYVASRLLKYYNDYVNYYEDLLANYDGRVVGGVNGKFRFSNTVNRYDSYRDITNDISDDIKVFDYFSSDGSFLPVPTPEYKRMYEYQAYSRLFGTEYIPNIIINDKTDPEFYGSVMGNVGKQNVKSIGPILSAISVSSFTSYDGILLEINKNGDPDTITPPFRANTPVNIYKDDGSFVGKNEIVAITGVNPGPFYLQLNIPITIRTGGVSLDNQDEGYDNKFYLPETDFAVDSDTGNIINITKSLFVTFGTQREFEPNSLLSTSVIYQNQSVEPDRIPVLDGSTLNDYGFPSVPPLRHSNEAVSLNEEKDYLLNYLNKTGSVFPALLDTIENCNLVVQLGDQIKFMNGPNAGIIKTVALVIDGSTFKVDSSFAAPGNDFSIVKLSDLNYYTSLVLNTIDLISNNVESSPVGNAYIGTVNSEFTCLDSIVKSSGYLSSYSIGTVSGLNLVDSSANFSDLSGRYVYVESGVNRGLYKIASNTSTTILLNNNYPFYAFFTPGSIQYKIVKKYDFLTETNFGFISLALRKTSIFYNDTSAWLNIINFSNVAPRVNQINNRIQDLEEFVESIGQICSASDSLYESRYGWINLKTNKSSGYISRTLQSIQARKSLTKNSNQNQNLVNILTGI